MKNKPVIVNSIPKSGTGLITNFYAFQGYKIKRSFNYICLDSFFYRFLRGAINKLSSRKYVFGIDMPLCISAKYLEMKVKFLKAGDVVGCHFFDIDFGVFLAKQNIALVNVIRSPGSILVSQFFYVKSNKKHPLYAFSNSISDAELLRFLYWGGEGEVRIDSLKERLSNFLKFIKSCRGTVVKFENIVGDENFCGRNEVFQILSEVANCEIIDRSGFFGAGKTFRSGAVNSWRGELVKLGCDSQILQELESLEVEYGY